MQCMVSNDARYLTWSGLRGIDGELCLLPAAGVGQTVAAQHHARTVRRRTHRVRERWQRVREVSEQMGHDTAKHERRRFTRPGAMSIT